MPTYSYICQFCNTIIDIFHSMNDASKHYCPKCKRLMNRKPTAPIGFIFKGSGFYSVDYKKREKNNET